jgi:hypothetical protein
MPRSATLSPKSLFRLHLLVSPSLTFRWLEPLLAPSLMSDVLHPLSSSQLKALNSNPSALTRPAPSQRTTHAICTRPTSLSQLPPQFQAWWPPVLRLRLLPAQARQLPPRPVPVPQVLTQLVLLLSVLCSLSSCKRRRVLGDWRERVEHVNTSLMNRLGTGGPSLFCVCD